MNADGFKFQASVKDADGDMVNVRADSAEELEAYLTSFPAGAYAQFKANVRGGQALGTIVQPQAQQALPSGSSFGGGDRGAAPWPSQPPQQVPQQGGGGYGGRPHPEGKQCTACGQVLQHGMTRTNKAQWKCPAYRYNNGNPNEHTLEWA